MKMKVLDMIKFCLKSEVLNKIYCYNDNIIVYLDNGEKVKITTRIYKGEQNEFTTNGKINFWKK